MILRGFATASGSHQSIQSRMHDTTAGAVEENRYLVIMPYNMSAQHILSTCKSPG